MHYRLYLPGDFPQLYAIEQLCFQPPFRFPRHYMQQLVNSPNSATWVAESTPAESKPAEEGGAMTGFTIVQWTHEDTQTIAYIQTLEVAPTHRKQGIASELLRRLESSATTAGAQVIWLHVAESNAAAIHLYQAHGYQPQGREEDYYGPGIPASVYSKSLSLGA